MSGAGVSETGKSTQGSFDGSIVGAENGLDLFSFSILLEDLEGVFLYLVGIFGRPVICVGGLSPTPVNSELG